MGLIELNELFEIEYGNKFDANKMNFVQNGDINFISRKSNNNGCVGTVGKYNSIEPYEMGLITVSLGGSFLLSSFLQPEQFYTAQNIAVLTPKKKMSVTEKIYYCKCISMNRFKYSAFGREANITLKNIKIPDTVPLWVQKTDPNKTSGLKNSFSDKKLSLEDCNMEYFSYSRLFEIKKGKRMVMSKTNAGNCPFVSSISKNNGVSDKLDLEPNHEGNTISLNYDGSIGEAYYQPNPFWALDSVNVLYPKFELNPYIAMFLITLIRKEKYRFNYGRKWILDRMKSSTIKLPVDNNGNPDWVFMEEFIKTLPYSKKLA